MTLIDQQEAAKLIRQNKDTHEDCQGAIHYNIELIIARIVVLRRSKGLGRREHMRLGDLDALYEKMAEEKKDIRVSEDFERGFAYAMSMVKKEPDISGKGLVPKVDCQM